MKAHNYILLKKKKQEKETHFFVVVNVHFYSYFVKQCPLWIVKHTVLCLVQFSKQTNKQTAFLCLVSQSTYNIHKNSQSNKC